MNLEKFKADPRMPKHIAFIIDGNGRWAKKRGLPRSAGHKVGADNVKKQIEVAYDLGIKNVSIYAFSCENWKRPKKETDYLMQLFEEMMDEYREEFIKRDVRIIFSGDFNDTRLPENVRNKAKKLVEDTKEKSEFIINLCINYGGRQEILKAVNELIDAKEKNIDFSKFEKHLYTAELLPLDLVIRTSGEQRSSNFMPWQTTYSEWIYPKKNWPAFGKRDLIKAIKIYMGRNRRFGEIKE